MVESLLDLLRDQFQRFARRRANRRWQCHWPGSSEPLESRRMLSAVVSPVADVNQEPRGLEWPIGLTAEMNGNTFFTLISSEHGQEIWRTDGTASGTERVTDINPGPKHGNIGRLLSFRNEIYFSASSDTVPYGMWRTDGTQAGTERFPVPTDSAEPIVVLDDLLYFLGRSSGNDHELWATDGTESGTRMILSLANRSHAGLISEVRLASNGKFFFVSRDSFGTSGLWVTEGTDVTTILLLTSSEPIYSLAPSSSELQDKSYFSVDDGQHGREPWVSDGTVSGTRLLADLNPGSLSSNPGGLSVIGNYATLVAQGPGEIRSLWRTSSTDNSPVELLTALTERPGFPRTATMDGKLYLLYDSTLWTSDGTPAGTAKASFMPDGVTVQSLVQIGGLLYMEAFDGINGREVWVSDGTPNGTSLIRDINPGGYSSVNFATFFSRGDIAVWAANDGIHGIELWASDGTGAHTRMLIDIERGTASSGPGLLNELNGDLYFTANDRSPIVLRNRKLYRIPADGSAPVIEVQNSSIDAIQSSRDHLFVMQTDGQYGREIRVLSGGALRILVDAAPGSEAGGNLPLYSFDGASYFFAVGPQSGLWKTNGNARGTMLIRQLPVPSGDSPVIRVFGDTMYFASRNPAGGFDLWQSDGTTAGTARLAADIPVWNSFQPVPVTASETTVIYQSAGHIWAVDRLSGTVTDIGNSPTGEVLNTYYAELFDDQLVILAQGTTRTGTALWTATAPTAEKRMIRSLHLALKSTDFARLGSDLIFVGSDSLWRMTLTTGELTMLYKFTSVSQQLEMSPFSLIEDKLFFSITDGSGFSQIMLTDGTPEGTVPVLNSEDPLLKTDLRKFVRYGQGIAFSALSQEFGREVFRIDTTMVMQPPSAIRLTDSYEHGVSLKWDDVRGAVQYEVWLQNLTDPTRAVVRKRISRPEFSLLKDLEDSSFGNPEDVVRVWIRSLPVLGEPSSWSDPKNISQGPKPTVRSIANLTFPSHPVISWGAVPDVDSYELWLSNLDTSSKVANLTDLRSESHTIIETLSPALYAVWVRGTRADGTKTAWSEVRKFSVLALPVQLKSGLGISSSARPVFGWDPIDGATGYDIELYSAETMELVYSVRNIRGLNHTPSKDLPAGRVTVYIRAMKGTRPLSGWGNGHELFLKLPPVGLKGNATQVAWDAVPSAVSYTFELRNHNGALVVPRTNTRNTSFNLAESLPPGRYTLRVFAIFADIVSEWSPTFAFELFRPPVLITSSDSPTADATPVITWRRSPDAVSYEVIVTRPGSEVPVYHRRNVTGTLHEIEVALPNGINQIQVRATFADGSTSALNISQKIFVGPAPVLSYVDGKVSWNRVNASTGYELWIDYLGSPLQTRIVHRPLYLRNQYSLPNSLPSGPYVFWIRTVRREGTDLYLGTWTSIRFDF